jgi:hypothetical protein
LVSQDKSRLGKQVNQDREAGQLVKRLDILDERLDNIDSIVTSLIERVMARPLVIEVTCPNCGQIIQISVTAGVRVRGRE